MAYASTTTNVDADRYRRFEGKRAAVSAALSSCPGISNHMIIQNGTSNTIRLYEYYINWGRAKVVPEANLLSLNLDEALFHAAGGWCATGSSGIVTYQLDDQTYLHILWDCPYNFNHFCNFIGLYFCEKEQNKPNSEMFNKMYQDIPEPGIIPRQLSPYDLVCCGPGERTTSPTGKCNWGLRRPCEVQNGKYYASMTMGDSHQTYSTVTVLE